MSQVTQQQSFMADYDNQELVDDSTVDSSQICISACIDGVYKQAVSYFDRRVIEWHDLTGKTYFESMHRLLQPAFKEQFLLNNYDLIQSPTVNHPKYQLAYFYHAYLHQKRLNEELYNENMKLSDDIIRLKLQFDPELELFNRINELEELNQSYLKIINQKKAFKSNPYMKLNKEKVKCDICGTLVSKVYIKTHQKKQHQQILPIQEQQDEIVKKVKTD